jgi:hypothetical protein
MIRTFQFSSKIVGGYQVKVDLNTVFTIGDIEQICTAQMIQFLSDNNLTDALSNVENKTFHIHDVTIDKIKNPDRSDVFYICDVCEG